MGKSQRNRLLGQAPRPPPSAAGGPGRSRGRLPSGQGHPPPAPALRKPLEDPASTADSLTSCLESGTLGAWSRWAVPACRGPWGDGAGKGGGVQTTGHTRPLNAWSPSKGGDRLKGHQWQREPTRLVRPPARLPPEAVSIWTVPKRSAAFKANLFTTANPWAIHQGR